MKTPQLAIIGCGTMGEAFARFLAPSYAVRLCDHDWNKSRHLAREIEGTPYKTATEAIEGADILLLAIKPQDLIPLSQEIGKHLQPHQLIISMLTGVTVSNLHKQFTRGTVVRIMPNLAVQYQKGVIAIAETTGITKAIRKTVEDLLQPLGTLYWFPENKLDAITALTGSGPAFLYVMIEAMVEAGIAMGLKPEIVKPLILDMMEGSMEMLENADKHPGELRWQICSPAGTTIAGLQKMEENAVRSGIMKTFLAAYERAKEMI